MDSKQKVKALKAQIALYKATVALGRELCKDDPIATDDALLVVHRAEKKLWRAIYPRSKPDDPGYTLSALTSKAKDSLFATLPVRTPVAFDSPTSDIAKWSGCQHHRAWHVANEDGSGYGKCTQCLCDGSHIAIEDRAFNEAVRRETHLCPCVNSPHFCVCWCHVEYVDPSVSYQCDRCMSAVAGRVAVNGVG